MALFAALVIFVGFALQYQLAVQGQPAWGIDAYTPILSTMSNVNSVVTTVVTNRILGTSTQTMITTFTSLGQTYTQTLTTVFGVTSTQSYTTVVTSLSTSYTTGTYVIVVTDATTTTTTATTAATTSTATASTATSPTTVTVATTITDGSKKLTNLTAQTNGMERDSFGIISYGADSITGRLTCDGVGLASKIVEIKYSWSQRYSLYSPPFFKRSAGSRVVTVLTDSNGFFIVTRPEPVGEYDSESGSTYEVGSIIERLDYAQFSGNAEYRGCKFTLVEGSTALASLLSLGSFFGGSGYVVHVEPIWFLLMGVAVGLAVFGVYKRHL